MAGIDWLGILIPAGVFILPFIILGVFYLLDKHRNSTPKPKNGVSSKARSSSGFTAASNGGTGNAKTSSGFNAYQFVVGIAILLMVLAPNMSSANIYACAAIGVAIIVVSFLDTAYAATLLFAKPYLDKYFGITVMTTSTLSGSKGAPLRILSNAQVKSLIQSWTPEQIWTVMDEMCWDLFLHTSSPNDSSSQTQCPPRLRLDLDSKGSCLLVKPALTPSSLATKILAPHNMSGTINIYDRRSGKPQAVMASRDMTSFRTALASIALLKYRWKDSITKKNIVIYGAGSIAYWTVWLLTKLWPNHLARITIVNRSDFYLPTFKLLEGIELKKFTVPDPIDSNFNARPDKDALAHADAVFCASGLRMGPSQDASGWFGIQMTAEWRNAGKAPYISLVGSFMTSMCEMSPLLVRELQRQNPESIVVDDVAGCTSGAGELTAAKGPFPSLGTVFEKHRNAKKAELKVNEILVYKSVGVGIMDASVGGKVYDLAEEMDAGTRIADFE